MSEAGNVPEPALAPERQAAIRRVVMAGLTATPPRPMRRRVVLVSAGVACSITIAGGSAAAWVAMTTPDESNAGYCSSTVTADRGVWELNGFSSVAEPGARVQQVEAIDSCRAMWAAGIVRPPGAQTDDPIEVPPLSACVVEGQLVVYPESDACSRLRVPALAP
jgi:hypothetical protein